MKHVALEQLPADVAELINLAQRERVVITRNGNPYALFVALENKDDEDLQREFSTEFWRMIEERRRSTASVPLSDVLAEVEAEEKRCRDRAVGAGAKT